MENHVAAFITEIEYPEISIEEIPALDFQISFLNDLADLLENSRKPKLTVSLFTMKEVPELGVSITPVDISDIDSTASSKTFLFQLRVVTSEAVTIKAYAQVLAVSKVVINVVKHITRRKSLTSALKLTILNSNELSLALTVKKTI